MRGLLVLDLLGRGLGAWGAILLRLLGLQLVGTAAWVLVLRVGRLRGVRRLLHGTEWRAWALLDIVWALFVGYC